MTGGIVEMLTGAVFKAGLSEAVKRVMGLRMEAAREILQDRLSRADIHIPEVADQDEAAAMVFAYIEAARQGAARRNLRMLADIMAGTLNSPPIYAEEFLRLSRVLADLSQEEMVALAVLHRVSLGIDDGTIPVDTARKGMATRTAVEQELLRMQITADRIELDAIFGALQRTGLVTWSPQGMGSTLYVPTKKLFEVMKLVDTDAMEAPNEDRQPPR